MTPSSTTSRKRITTSGSTGLCLVFYLLSWGWILAENPEDKLIQSLLPPGVEVGMTRDRFDQLKLATLGFPNRENDANAILVLQDKQGIKNHIFRFFDHTLAEISTFWPPSKDSFKDFIPAYEQAIALSTQVEK